MSTRGLEKDSEQLRLKCQLEAGNVAASRVITGRVDKSLAQSIAMYAGQGPAAMGADAAVAALMS